jgi:hypothetical protein
VTADPGGFLPPRWPADHARVCGRPDQDAILAVGEVVRFAGTPCHFGGHHRTFMRLFLLSASPDALRDDTVSVSLLRPRPDTDHAPGMGRRDHPHAPRVSQARSRREPPRRSSGRRRAHGPTSGTRGLPRVWLPPPWSSPLPSALCPLEVLSWDPAPLLSERWVQFMDRHGPPHLPSPPASASPSTSMKTMSCGHAGRFTQTAAATNPVRCPRLARRRPPVGDSAGWSSAHACMPRSPRSRGRSRISSGVAAQPYSLFDPRDPAGLAKGVDTPSLLA